MSHYPCQKRLVPALAALLLLSSIAVSVVAPTPAAADAAPVDVRAIDPVPDRIWGVSGQDASETQTETIDNLVWDFAQIGNRMFVGGAFLNVQESKYSTPISQPFLAAFDVDSGDWVSSWTPQVDRAVYSLDVLQNGSLLVGGEFETVNGQAHAGLVALNPLTGTIDRSFDVEVERPWGTRRAVVREAKAIGESVYIAGNFSHITDTNGVRKRVYKAARVSAAGSVDPGWLPQVAGSGVWGIAADPASGEVHLSGFFSSVNGEADTGHFHTVDATTGATVAGKQELPRNLPGVQPEMFDVALGDGIVFVVGEQHILQVLETSDHNMIGYHTTGIRNNGFVPTGYVAGGAFQVGERIGDVVIAGCHCTYSERNGVRSHYSSFDGKRTARRLAMAYDATTGELIEEFDPDINSDRDGTWAVGSDTNGCLYLGGDYHLGGLDAGRQRWIGGFARLCGDSPVVQEPPAEDLLIQSDADWRYNQDGVDLGTAWRNPSFDDGDWPVGQAELGFGDAGQATPLTPGFVTYYARTTFAASGPPPDSLELGLKADDGAVVYLNGVEVLRDNMPDGAIDYRTTAEAWRGSADETIRSFIIPADALVEGVNVLAVEVHNVWAGNNDLRLAASLAPSAEPPIVAPASLVPLGAEWTYVDSGSDAPGGWPNRIGAGVAGRTDGNGEFGFGDGGEETVLRPGQEAYYFAHDFEVDDAAAIGSLDLTLLADDGAVVYLNGQEIHRFNMPDGPVGWATRPVEWIAGPSERPYTTTIDGPPLVAGQNTITVEVHNFWPGNSDLSFDLRLVRSDGQ